MLQEKIEQQIRFAEIKHGKLTGSLERKLFILWEEVGEVIKEINNIEEGQERYSALDFELAQTGAVVYRFLESIQEQVREEKEKQVKLFD